MTAPPPPVLTALRTQTAAAHKALESATDAGSIMDGSLTPAGYETIIDWQARAHHALEPFLTALPAAHDYKTRQGFLPIVSLTATEQRLIASTSANDLHFALGIAYVLEGGSLGGSLIHRKLLANEKLTAHRPFPFYQFQADEGIGQWKAYVAYLQSREFDEGEIERVVAGAVFAFALFRKLWGVRDQA